MRRKVFFLQAAMLALLGNFFSGCDNDDEQTVEQPAPEATVAIVRSSDVSDTSFSVSFHPTENTSKWVYALGEDGMLDDFTNDTMEGMVATEGNATLEKTFEGLTAGTIYTVYAKAYNADGKAGAVSIMRFPTEETFDVEQQYLLSTSSGFKMKFSPVLYKVRYYLGTAADREDFLADRLENDGEISERTEYTANYFDLQPSTEYVFYAMAYDRANAPRAFAEKPIQTKGGGEFPFAELTPGAENDPFEGTYTVSCPGLGKMIGMICKKGMRDEMINSDVHWKGDIVKMLQSWENVPGMAEVAENGKPIQFKLQTSALKTGLQLESYILMLDTEGEVLGVQHFDFINVEKKEDVLVPEVTIEIKDEDITTTGGKYTITAKNTWGMLYNTLDADWYDKIKEDGVDESGNPVDEFYIHNLLLLGGQWWAYKPAEPIVYEETTGTPGKRYYAVVCPMNVNGADGWGEMVLKEFTTKR